MSVIMGIRVIGVRDVSVGVSMRRVRVRHVRVRGISVTIHVRDVRVRYIVVVITMRVSMNSVTVWTIIVKVAMILMWDVVVAVSVAIGVWGIGVPVGMTIRVRLIRVWSIGVGIGVRVSMRLVTVGSVVVSVIRVRSVVVSDSLMLRCVEPGEEKALLPDASRKSSLQSRVRTIDLPISASRVDVVKIIPLNPERSS